MLNKSKSALNFEHLRPRLRVWGLSPGLASLISPSAGTKVHKVYFLRVKGLGRQCYNRTT